MGRQGPPVCRVPGRGGGCGLFVGKRGPANGTGPGLPDRADPPAAAPAAAREPLTDSPLSVTGEASLPKSVVLTIAETHVCGRRGARRPALCARRIRRGPAQRRCQPDPARLFLPRTLPPRPRSSRGCEEQLAPKVLPSDCAQACFRAVGAGSGSWSPSALRQGLRRPRGAPTHCSARAHVG